MSGFLEKLFCGGNSKKSAAAAPGREDRIGCIVIHEDVVKSSAEMLDKSLFKVFKWTHYVVKANHPGVRVYFGMSDGFDLRPAGSDFIPQYLASFNSENNSVPSVSFKRVQK